MGTNGANKEKTIAILTGAPSDPESSAYSQIYIDKMADALEKVITKTLVEKGLLHKDDKITLRCGETMPGDEAAATLFKHGVVQGLEVAHNPAIDASAHTPLIHELQNLKPEGYSAHTGAPASLFVDSTLIIDISASQGPESFQIYDFASAKDGFDKKPPQATGKTPYDGVWNNASIYTDAKIHIQEGVIAQRARTEAIDAGLIEDHKDKPAPSIVATMYFSYGQNAKRQEVKSDTTFKAILAGERTSTTRFYNWAGTDQYKRLKAGDTIRFHERADKKGRAVDVTFVTIIRSKTGRNQKAGPNRQGATSDRKTARACRSSTRTPFSLINE